MDLRSVLRTVVMSLDLALYAWPFTILVVGATGWGAFSLFKAQKLRTWQSMTVLGSIVFPVLLVPIYTVEFWADHKIHTAETQETPLHILVVGWALFAIVVIGSIIMARGFRLPLACLASTVVWFGAGMYLISIMAVSGVWL
jgi:hypothetical protein